MLFGNIALLPDNNSFWLGSNLLLLDKKELLPSNNSFRPDNNLLSAGSNLLLFDKRRLLLNKNSFLPSRIRLLPGKTPLQRGIVPFFLAARQMQTGTAWQ
jgi:hypothetical protein